MSLFLLLQISNWGLILLYKHSMNQTENYCKSKQQLNKHNRVVSSHTITSFFLSLSHTHTHTHKRTHTCLMLVIKYSNNYSLHFSFFYSSRDWTCKASTLPLNSILNPYFLLLTSSKSNFPFLLDHNHDHKHTWHSTPQFVIYQLINPEDLKPSFYDSKCRPIKSFLYH
jgi:hypothetical protein